MATTEQQRWIHDDCGQFVVKGGYGWSHLSDLHGCTTLNGSVVAGEGISLVALNVTILGTSGNGRVHHLKLIVTGRSDKVRISKDDPFTSQKTPSWTVQVWRQTGWSDVATYGEADGVNDETTPTDVAFRAWVQVLG